MTIIYNCARQRSIFALRKRPLSTSSYSSTYPCALDSLLAYGERVLRSPDSRDKVALTMECKALWDDQQLPIHSGSTWETNPPPQPARSALPPLYSAKEMPSIKDMAAPIPVAMLHALAHIELGAIDNYWDTLVRFDPVKHHLPREFYDDFLRVASDEARHFAMVDDRLREIGSFYGALPATKALLEHASNTSEDLAARIAVIPLVQEARGLDSGDRLVHRLKSMGDKESADIVAQIVFEERSHVAYGMKWFRYLCAHHPELKEVDPISHFHELVLRFFPDGLPGPFDMEARLAATMEAAWYLPLESKLSGNHAQPCNKEQTENEKGFQLQSARLAAFAASKRKVILAGSVWPERTSSAAGVRSSDLIDILQGNGYEVLCVSPSRLNEHTDKLMMQCNVQCVQADANTDALQQLLLATSPQLVIFDRFIAEEMYSWQVQKYAPEALRVLDLQDVHSLRKARELLVKKQNVNFMDTLDWSTLPSDSFVGKQIIRELAAIHRSDLTLYVSDFEHDLLTRRFQIQDEQLHRCDFFYPPIDMSSLPAFSERKNVAFIGSFKHSPNVDAVEWLKRDILPLFRQESSAELHIYGSYGQASRFTKLDDPQQGFRMMGFAPDVHDTLRKYRLTIAPLRFGAGIKGKIADSWFVGTPCVSTAIGAEGMNLPLHSSQPSSSAWGGSIVNDPHAFAKAMQDLYINEVQWRSAQQIGIDICRERYDRQRNATQLMEKLDFMLYHKQALRDSNWIGRILWSEKFRATEYMSKYIRAKNEAVDKTVS